MRSLSVKKRLVKAVAIDLAVFAGLLNAFAYFHHVRVYDEEPVAVPGALVQATPAPAAAAAPADAQQDGAPTIAPAADVDLSGQFGAQFADKFTSGEVVSDESSYQSRNVSIRIERRQVDQSVCFIADIYVRDVSCFRTGVALEYSEYNTTNRKNCMQVLQMDELTDAIVAISGDNYVFRNGGVLAVRNGMEWKKKLPFTDDICVLLNDGSMEVFSTKSASVCRNYVEELYTRGVYQVWCFGPRLLDDNGQPMEKFNSSVSTENPRAAVGYYEPGHYCFVLVDGRQKDYSLGMSLSALSQLFYDLGCKLAYNLDGGDTVAMTFNDALVNHPEEEEPRAVSDILYIGEPVGLGAQAETAAQEGAGDEVD